MLVQTAKLSGQVKVPFRSNNPSRATNCCRVFPQFHPVTTFNSGLSGGSFLIEHQASVLLCVSRTILMRQSAFLRQYRALSQLPACIAPKPHLYLRDWMVVDYLPGEVKRICRIPTNWQAAVLSTSTTAFWLANNAVAVTGTVLAAKRSGAADSGLAANVKRLRKAREPRPLHLSPLHMDVHAGNLVHSASGLKLIDWSMPEMVISRWNWRRCGWKILTSIGNWSMTMPLARRFIRRNYGVRSGDGFGSLMLKAGGLSTAGDKPAINNLSGWLDDTGGSY